MNITAQIEEIKYTTSLENTLTRIPLLDFDVNKAPSSCIIESHGKLLAISKWKSPKRTRTYPFARVYDTYSQPKKITVIPIVKDEGFAGDRDFIQWDTISLMSLLNVYVIFGYYVRAKKHRTRKDKITAQEFDNEFIISKINEINNHHTSALHWNMNQLKGLSELIKIAKQSYSEIGRRLKVRMHGEAGLDEFQARTSQDLDAFMEFSRQKAEQAQRREIQTDQPKERLRSRSKSQITIVNWLGGKYFLTVDEVLERGNKELMLIESKHSTRSLLPSINDIKDGLIKLILFCNLAKVIADGKPIEHRAVLQLTSSQLRGGIRSDSSPDEIEKFFKANRFRASHKTLALNLFDEARANQFDVAIQRG